MQNKKELIVAQIFISVMMAFLMTGIFSFIQLGATTDWLSRWEKSFVMAWPIAFVLSLIIGPLAFKLAAIVTRQKQPT